ncbi:SDR family oxidoreductase [Kutzneria sp. CA-103260]|uniref:SDR family oxidoreductase n=1 Tax=Kutzneria sp. CA-103260 TaxID=2802641 RepID=UPI001BABF06D|nr:SDR family oxidoreductase [Kutzneria sp. CA-103260]QUQ64742.1 NAD-dependent epimerase/dehydratase [Kutzneria sp. CA-103260]
MRVFVTGATGFVGSAAVAELIGAGHEVIGLSRSDAGAQALVRAGATVVRGDVNDLRWLREVASDAEAVIHTAFNHEAPADARQQCENDRKVIATLGAATSGPLIVTSGTGLAQSAAGGAVTEADPHAPSSMFPRAATEEAADALIEQGRNVMVIRLPQVHDSSRQGRILRHIQLAKQQGTVAYIGDGDNRLPAAHVTDVARLYRLVLDNGRQGARYHAVTEQGVPLRAIAEVLGDRMGLPVQSLTPQQAPAYFGPLLQLAELDLPASGAHTQQRLDWRPTGPDLLTDLRNTDYTAIC